MEGVATSNRDDIGVSKPPRETASLDCQEAFQQIAKRCVRLIRRNRKPAIAGDAEAIHAMRIELTRLRAAVLFFAPMTNDVAASSIDKKLHWLNAALGTARDHDVTMSYARRKRYRSWAKGSRRSLLRSQGRSHRRLARKLDSARYSRLMVELNHWISNGSWLRDAQSPSYERIDDYSEGRLREWRKAIRRDGQHIRTLRPKPLHRFRIRCKRFRYIVAALQALKVPLARKELTFCEVARQVHGALGDLRDLKRLRKAGHGRLPGYRMRKRNLLREAGRPFRRSQARRIHPKPVGGRG